MTGLSPRFAFALLIVPLTGCGLSQGPEEAAIELARSEVASLLVDPSSAQFRNVEAYVIGEDVHAVCGQINAKNRMGGYDGFRRFVFLVETRAAMIEPNSIVPTGDPIVDGLRSATVGTDFNVAHAHACVTGGLPTIEESERRRAEAEAKLREIQGEQ